MSRPAGVRDPETGTVVLILPSGPAVRAPDGTWGSTVPAATLGELGEWDGLTDEEIDALLGETSRAGFASA